MALTPVIQALPSSSSPMSPPKAIPALSIEYEDGDVILRADDTDFRVHINILCQASPFFCSLFTIPQPKDAEEVPVIPMTEDAEVLHALIRIIYPVSYKLSIQSLEFAVRLLKAADKLQIECAMDPIRASITPLLEAEHNPLRAWAWAVRLDHKEAQKAAVRRYIVCDATLTSRKQVEELRYVNALDYFKLVQKREKALHEAKIAITSTVWGCTKCGKTPSWRAEYEKEICGRNPFIHDVASDLLFEICAHRSGCPMCLESVRSRNLHASTKTPSRLRARLSDILTKYTS